MKIDIDTRDFGRLASALGASERKIDYHISQGLNAVAFAAMRNERKKIPDVFDRPSKFTQSGIQVERAKRGKLEAAVFVEDKRAKYLAIHEDGGEVSSREAAGMRGSGKEGHVIPVANEAKNASGSAGRNAVKRLLKLPQTFKVNLRDGSRAILQRTGAGRAAVRTIALMADRVRYPDEMFEFHDRVSRDVTGLLDTELSERVDKIIDEVTKRRR